MLQENDVAPDFSLPSDRGETVTLSSFRGKKVVVYFYPKDNTPGCTREACSFRDAYGEFLGKGAVVIGISPDTASSHDRFRARYGLPFYLLSDRDHAVAERYGAWGEKTSFGKKTVGILRSTFIVGEDGRIVKVFPRVSPEGHAQEVLEHL